MIFPFKVTYLTLMSHFWGTFTLQSHPLTVHLYIKWVISLKSTTIQLIKTFKNSKRNDVLPVKSPAECWSNKNKLRLHSGRGSGKLWWCVLAASKAADDEIYYVLFCLSVCNNRTAWVECVQCDQNYLFLKKCACGKNNGRHECSFFLIWFFRKCQLKYL